MTLIMTSSFFIRVAFTDLDVLSDLWRFDGFCLLQKLFALISRPSICARD